MLKLLAVLTIGWFVTGCSESVPIEIDIDKAAADAGLTPDDYKVREDGTIQIYSKSEESNEDKPTL